MWQITAIMAFVLVLMGFTRAMSSTNPMEVLAWSLAWIVPIAVPLFVRNAVSVPFSQWDKWAGAVALVSFLPAAGFLPSALQAVAGALW